MRSTRKRVLVIATAAAMAIPMSGCSPDVWLACVLGQCAVDDDLTETGEDAPARADDLRAVAGNGRVDLVWKASVSRSVSAYRVERRVESDAGDFVGVDVEFASPTSAIDRTVVNETTYLYRVFARDSRGIYSSASNVVRVTPSASADPSAPPYLRTLGGTGTELGYLDNPQGLGVDVLGAIYVADAGNRRVHRFDADGQISRTFGGPASLDFPVDVAVGRRGDVYVSDRVRNRVVRYDSEGILRQTWGGGPPSRDPGSFNEPGDLALGPDGSLYVVDAGNHRIQKFDSAGTFVRFYEELQPPLIGTGIALGDDGSIYTTQQHQAPVQKRSNDGTLVATWASNGEGPGQLGGPTGIALGPAGDFFVSESSNHRVQRFDSAGNPLTRWGEAGSGPGRFSHASDVAVDCRGNVYVADAEADVVQKFGDPMSPAPPCAGSVPPDGPALVLASRARRFRATFKPGTLTRGRPSFAGPLAKESGVIARGTFKGSLAGRGKIDVPGLKRFDDGRWVTKFDFTWNNARRTGVAKGWSVAKAGRHRLCLRFRTSLDSGLRLRGTFRIAGGSGAGSRIYASGTFTQVHRADKTFTITGSGRARAARTRKMPAACRSVARVR